MYASAVNSSGALQSCPPFHLHVSTSPIDELQSLAPTTARTSDVAANMQIHGRLVPVLHGFVMNGQSSRENNGMNFKSQGLVSPSPSMISTPLRPVFYRPIGNGKAPSKSRFPLDPLAYALDTQILARRRSYHRPQTFETPGTPRSVKGLVDGADAGAEPRNG